MNPGFAPRHPPKHRPLPPGWAGLGVRADFQRGPGPAQPAAAATTEPRPANSRLSRAISLLSLPCRVTSTAMRWRQARNSALVSSSSLDSNWHWCSSSSNGEGNGAWSVESMRLSVMSIGLPVVRVQMFSRQNNPNHCMDQQLQTTGSLAYLPRFAPPATASAPATMRQGG